MNSKQRYYASLERQRAAEASLRAQGQTERGDKDSLDELYVDMGVRTFAAFQSCLDWLAGLGSGRRAALEGMAAGSMVDTSGKIDVTLAKISEDINGVKEQLSKLELSLANVESGMRRIDKYTLDAFRQLAEVDTAHVSVSGTSAAVGVQRQFVSGQRLAKEEARRLALDTAKTMAIAGRSLSLAAVAREAGLKYGQIVYAFGNKDTFLNELAALSNQSETAATQAGSEVAASFEHPF